MRFRLLSGTHQEGSFFENRKYIRGNTFEAGVVGQDIIETENDLSKHNTATCVRFERLPDLMVD